ncbi:MAG: hypothetical protein FJX74_03465, partial [Armatimonadetes bacterium]|nr:hypothetical protein [Armatimonadota bacterium]
MGQDPRAPRRAGRRQPLSRAVLSLLPGPRLWNQPGGLPGAVASAALLLRSAEEPGAGRGGAHRQEERVSHGSGLEGSEPFPRRGARYIRVKRIADALLAVAGLVGSAPLLGLRGLLVWVTSGRPVLYRQRRVGLDGREFEIVKLRTMRVDAEAETGPVWAEAADPRATPVGTLLRQTFWDELPQLWNVPRGDMSLIGPRPERPEFVADFRRSIPDYDHRHRVRPGMTGLAQIHGYRGNTSVVGRTEYDLAYVRQQSLGLDCWVALRTTVVLAAAVRGALTAPLRAWREKADRPAGTGDAPAFWPKPGAIAAVLGACATCDVSSDAAGGLARLLETPGMVGRLSAMAAQQGVAATVYRHALESGSPASLDLAARLRPLMMRDWSWSVAVQAQVARIASELAAVGVPLVVLKGAALVLTCYPPTEG